MNLRRRAGLGSRSLTHAGRAFRRKPIACVGFCRTVWSILTSVPGHAAPQAPRGTAPARASRDRRPPTAAAPRAPRPGRRRATRRAARCAVRSRKQAPSPGGLSCRSRLPPILVCQLAADGQAEPEAALGGPWGRRAALEAGEDALAVLGGHAPRPGRTPRRSPSRRGRRASRRRARRRASSAARCRAGSAPRGPPRRGRRPPSTGRAAAPRRAPRRGRGRPARTPRPPRGTVRPARPARSAAAPVSRAG